MQNAQAVMAKNRSRAERGHLRVRYARDEMRRSDRSKAPGATARVRTRERTRKEPVETAAEPSSAALAPTTPSALFGLEKFRPCRNRRNCNVRAGARRRAGSTQGTSGSHLEVIRATRAPVLEIATRDTP